MAEVDDRRAAEEEVLLGVEYGDLGGALSTLSPELRAVVQATVLDGLTSREAGRLLGHPGRHREDADDARPRAAERGAGMSWHVHPELLEHYAARRRRRGAGVLGRGAPAGLRAVPRADRGARRRGAPRRRLGRRRGAPRRAPPRPVEAGLVRLGVREHVARLLGATPVAAAVVAPRLRRSCSRFAAWAASGDGERRVLRSSCSRRCCRSPASRSRSAATSIRPTRSALAAPMRSFGLLLIRARRGARVDDACSPALAGARPAGPALERRGLAAAVARADAREPRALDARLGGAAAPRIARRRVAGRPSGPAGADRASRWTSSARPGSSSAPSSPPSPRSCSPATPTGFERRGDLT